MTENQRNLQVAISEDQKRALKILAIQRGVTVSDIIRELVTKELEKNA